jgi:hypothetical protein
MKFSLGALQRNGIHGLRFDGYLTMDRSWWHKTSHLHGFGLEPACL